MMRILSPRSVWTTTSKNRRSQPNLDQLGVVAQALAGPALKGAELENVSPTAEQSVLSKLLANWNSVMECRAAREERQTAHRELLSRYESKPTLSENFGRSECLFR